MNLPQSQIGVIDKKFLSRSVGQLELKDPLVLSHQSSIREAVKLLQDNKVGCVMLVDNSDKLVGIFTERDVVLKMFDENFCIQDGPIEEVMTKDPKTVEMTTQLAFALNMMSDGGFRHIPVTDEENFPVAILSVKDLVDYIAQTVTNDLQKL